MSFTLESLDEFFLHSDVITNKQTNRINEMTSKEFAESFYQEKEELLDIYFERKINEGANMVPKSDVAELIKQINLNDADKLMLLKIVDGALRDAFYTILLGLDGCAAIGNGLQQIFELKDEDGNELTGDLESHAYDFFHAEK